MSVSRSCGSGGREAGREPTRTSETGARQENRPESATLLSCPTYLSAHSICHTTRCPSQSFRCGWSVSAPPPCVRQARLLTPHSGCQSVERAWVHEVARGAHGHRLYFELYLSAYHPSHGAAILGQIFTQRMIGCIKPGSLEVVGVTFVSAREDSSLSSCQHTLMSCLAIPLSLVRVMPRRWLCSRRRLTSSRAPSSTVTAQPGSASHAFAVVSTSPCS